MNMQRFLAAQAYKKTQNMKPEKIKVFIVDDDQLFLQLLEFEFSQHADFIIETFTTGEECLENLCKQPDVIILDYFLDSVVKHAMNGMEILYKIKAFNPDIPVVLLSQAKIELPEDFMENRPFDYVMKSRTAFARLQRVLFSIFRNKKNGKEIEMVYGDGTIPFQLSVFSC
jgi:two-component system OmpR family response regulator